MENKDNTRAQLSFNVDKNLYNQYKQILFNVFQSTVTGDLIRFMDRFVRGTDNLDLSNISKTVYQKTNLRKVTINVKPELYTSFKNKVLNEKNLNMNLIVLIYIHMVVETNLNKDFTNNELTENSNIQKVAFYIDENLYHKYRSFLITQGRSVSEDLSDYIKSVINNEN